MQSQEVQKTKAYSLLPPLQYVNDNSVL